ncbi:MAG: hypothetical protein KC478_08860 [Bacteriovoracaceae bacterium]|nr:hypothetical protein [Bacteriovoracaceae bacterium]
MKALSIIFLFISCAGLKTEHCSNEGAKNHAKQLASKLVSPDDLIDIRANSCNHSDNYSSEEYTSSFNKAYQTELRKSCSPSHVAKLAAKDGSAQVMNFGICENYADVNRLEAIYKKQRENSFKVKNNQQRFTTLASVQQQKEPEHLGNLILSQRSFRVKDKAYETNCKIIDDMAIGTILPELADDTANFNAFFQFDYFDTANRKIGSEKQHASITIFDMSSELESSGLPRDTDRCILTYLDSH